MIPPVLPQGPSVHLLKQKKRNIQTFQELLNKDSKLTLVPGDPNKASPWASVTVGLPANTWSSGPRPACGSTGVHRPPPLSFPQSMNT